VIVFSLGLSRLRRKGKHNVTDQLTRALIKAQKRPFGVIWQCVQVLSGQVHHLVEGIPLSSGGARNTLVNEDTSEDKAILEAELLHGSPLGANILFLASRVVEVCPHA